MIILLGLGQEASAFGPSPGILTHLAVDACWLSGPLEFEFYLRTAQAIPSGCLPGENCPTTSSVFKSTTTILSAVLTAT